MRRRVRDRFLQRSWPMHRSKLVAFAALLTLPVLAGCATEEPKSPDRGLTEPVRPPQPPDLGREPGTIEIDAVYSMYITQSVLSVCAGPDPFFAFNSAGTAKDQPTMKVLADCMISGPLRARSIKLIGHTDPRGTAQHNEDLGLRRAAKVKEFLVRNGVEEGRVLVASVGAEGADPSPKEWGKDRRVQIELVPVQ
jgi:outer membrane protein OmpA-like peptidoglycan-associated protein